MKKTIFAVSCLLQLIGLEATITSHSYQERKQHIKSIMQRIRALNVQADAIILQRDRLTAYLRAMQKRLGNES